MSRGPVTADGLADQWHAAWSGGDPGAFAEVCAPDLHYEDPLTVEPLEGPARLGAHAERLWRAFPDARLRPTAPRLSDGRHVALPCKLVATHRGELAGLAPSGRFLVLHAIFYCELDSARQRLWRVRGFFDVYDAAVQLGIMPARGTLAERALLVLRGFGLRAGSRTRAS